MPPPTALAGILVALRFVCLPHQLVGYLLLFYNQLGETAGIKETPEQKFQRLQHEIRELTEDINLIKVTIDNENVFSSKLSTKFKMFSLCSF